MKTLRDGRLVEVTSCLDCANWTWCGIRGQMTEALGDGWRILEGGVSKRVMEIMAQGCREFKREFDNESDS